MKLYISLFKENIIYQNYNEMFKYKIKFKLNIYIKCKIVRIQKLMLHNIMRSIKSQTSSILYRF